MGRRPFNVAFDHHGISIPYPHLTIVAPAPSKGHGGIVPDVRNALHRRTPEQ
jgi:hypothetical protein